MRQSLGDSRGDMIAEGTFEIFLARIQAATLEQCASLTY